VIKRAFLGCAHESCLDSSNYGGFGMGASDASAALSRRADAAPLGPLVGRERERRLLAGLIDAADGGGAAAVILGEAGMGKTSLLELVGALARRRGMAVVALRGVEPEAVLPFAAIADLLLPLRDHMGRLPATQRQALEVCLALRPGPAHGPLAACAGALGVLAAASEDRPLVVTVDDFQWVDAESAQILLFVARRLAPEHIVMVLAVREEPDASLPATNLPMLRLTGLSEAECAELARRHGITVSQAALRSLVESTGGNPLAVVEHLRTAAGGAGARAAEDSGTPALHASLERTWGRLLEQVPDDTRTALFVIAADHGAGGSHTAGALDRLGVSLQSLAPAERLGLIRYVDGEVHLRHPLLRSVVFARTPLATRVRAFEALAGAADGYLRTWYLAEAATGPDEALASALAAASGNARERNGFGASARILRRAAELTDAGPLRADRLLQAAHDAHLAGDAHAAVAWCEEALKHRSDPAFVVDVERVAGRARTWMGDPSRAFDRMVRAAAMVRQVDARRAAQVLAEATAPAAMQGHAGLMRQVAEQVEDVWNDSAEVAEAATATVLVMVAEAFVLTGELHRAEPYLRRAAKLLVSNPLSEIEGVGFLAQSLTWIERYAEARQHLAALQEAGRRLASPSILSFALTVSAEVGWWTGRWAAAYADATEALQWSEEHAQPGLIGWTSSTRPASPGSSATPTPAGRPSAWWAANHRPARISRDWTSSRPPTASAMRFGGRNC
jgi:tetratricopeptide (TPR) repeat protein